MVDTFINSNILYCHHLSIHLFWNIGTDILTVFLFLIAIIILWFLFFALTTDMFTYNKDTSFNLVNLS